MSRNSHRKLMLLTAAVATAAFRVRDLHAGAFLSPKDLLVLESNSDGDSAYSADSVTINEYNPTLFGTGTPVPVNTINLPTDTLSYGGANNLGLTLPDTSDHDGQLTVSQDGHQLVFGTYLAAVGPVDYYGTDVGPNDVPAEQVPRVITVLHPDGSLDDSTQLTGPYDYDGISIRQVNSLDGTQFWSIGNGDKPYGDPNTLDIGGIRYSTLGANTTTSMNVGNGIDARTLAIWQGQLYVAGGSNNSPPGEHTLSALGSGIPETGTPGWSPLPATGAYSNGNIFGNQSPSFVSLNDGTTVLYQSDSTAGTVDKYTLINGVWNLEGQIYFTKDNIENVLATVNSDGSVTVYIDNGGTAVYDIQDTGGDGTLKIPGLSNSHAAGQPSFYLSLPAPLMVAAPGKTFRGLSFAPSASAAVGNQIWASSTGGSWTAAANWADGIPNASGATATFALNTPGLLSSGVINLDGTKTVGHIVFNNATANYTLNSGSGGVLNIDNTDPNAGGVPSIFNVAGNHTINAPITMAAGLTLSSAYNSSLTVKNSISGPGGLIIAGPGVTSLLGTNTYTGGTTIDNGTTFVVPSLATLPANSTVINNGTLQVNAGTRSSPIVFGNSPVTGAGDLTGSGTLNLGTAGTAAFVQLAANGATTSVATANPTTLSALNIAPGSTLDITNNELLITYTGADPTSSIKTALASAYAGGAFTGTGLTSSTVAAEDAAAKGTTKGVWSIGYIDGSKDGAIAAANQVGANQILIEPELLADGNLDGQVNFSDLVIVAQNFGSTTADWTHGDFNYDSIVNFNDLVSLAQNLGKTNGNTLLSSELPASFQAQWSLAQAEVAASGGGTNSVPEPGTMSLLGIGAAGLLARRRRNNRR